LTVGHRWPALILLALAIARPAAGADDPVLYHTWCARCHGERGDGKGPAAVALAFNGAAPRDFTAGLFKWKSTPSGQPPTDDDLARVIANGVPGTAMPYFRDLLRPDEIDALIGVVRGFARRPAPAGKAVDLGAEPPDEASLGARGATLFPTLGCPECHGAGGQGDGRSAPMLRNPDGSRAAPADLTRPWTFRGGSRLADVAMRLATGIDGTPMPSYLEVAPAADLWATAAYVRSLARAPSLEQAAIASARDRPGNGVPLRERGEYLVKAGTCFLCHVQMTLDGSYLPGSFGAGGMRIEITHTATVFSRNLTSDPDTGIGLWEAADVRRALRDGRSRDGRALNPLDMPWPILAGLSDRDLDAIHAYLTSLPPVRNAVPAPRAPDLRDGLVGKLGALVAGEQIRAGFFPLNAGREVGPTEEPPAVANPRTGLVMTIAAALAIVAAVVARRRLGVAVVALVVVAAVAVPTIYTWPPLEAMPPGLVRAVPPYETLGRLFGLPPLRPPPAPVDVDDPDVRALAERGRYLASLATCTLCHTAGPSVTRLYAPFPEMGGGMRVNWRVFGTVYSRNLTPDRETGLGRWSRDEIRRAITSGIAKDGRRMHWQAMPWDHFSRFSPEDLEALIVYLQHLPPVFSRVPSPEPPAADDEEGDTFWFGYTGEYRPASSSGATGG
jgi:mono/diheme cytochrome c family protein